MTTVGGQLAKQAFGEYGNWLPIIHIARCNLASQEFTTLINDQMQLEAIKPAHRTLAALGELSKHLVSMYPMVITNQQGGGVNEGKSVTAPVQALQISAQRSQYRRHQDHKTLITHQFRKLASQMLTDMFGVIGFEISVLRLMKTNNNRHDFTDTQLSCALTFSTFVSQQFSLPEWQKALAKIIYTHKQFE